MINPHNYNLLDNKPENVFSFQKQRRFTGLITSIFKEFSPFAILCEVILRDSKPNHDLGHKDAFDVSVSDKKRNVNSRRVFTHRC